MTTRRKPMKLFVWEGVLCDHTAGMIVALAPDLETALALAPSDAARGEMVSNVKFAEVTEVLTHAEPKLWFAYGGG